jgi:hypothetical protein
LNVRLDSDAILNLRGNVVTYVRRAGGRFLVRGHLTDARHVYAGIPSPLRVEDAVQVDTLCDREREKHLRRMLHDAVDDFCN